MPKECWLNLCMPLSLNSLRLLTHSVSPEADANRLAHIFLDERKDAKGNNVLFVQEMQSDWAQTGQGQGVCNINKLPEC
jgi:hypothetical protein